MGEVAAGDAGVTAAGCRNALSRGKHRNRLFEFGAVKHSGGRTQRLRLCLKCGICRVKYFIGPAHSACTSSHTRLSVESIARAAASGSFAFITPLVQPVARAPARMTFATSSGVDIPAP